MSQVPRILILEDDNDLRDMLEEVLRDEGYQVIAVSNGADAVAQAGSQNFDLIIADIRMKGMDGLEAVEQTQKINPNIGSLIVSGYATEEDISRAQRRPLCSRSPEIFQLSGAPYPGWDFGGQGI